MLKCRKCGYSQLITCILKNSFRNWIVGLFRLYFLMYIYTNCPFPHYFQFCFLFITLQHKKHKNQLKSATDDWKWTRSKVIRLSKCHITTCLPPTWYPIKHSSIPHHHPPMTLMPIWSRARCWFINTSLKCLHQVIKKNTFSCFFFLSFYQFII